MDTQSNPFIDALYTHVAFHADGRLNDQKVDRKALAILRRGLSKSPGEDIAVYRYVIPFAPKGEELQRSYFIVASLFAVHPCQRPNERFSFGVSWRKLQQQDTSSEESCERRFIALINAPSDIVHEHLRHAVALMKAKSVAVDWEQLLKDLMRWDNPNRSTQRNWARDFWKKDPNIATSANGTELSVSNSDE